jgi:hypothetical protein
MRVSVAVPHLEPTWLDVAVRGATVVQLDTANVAAMARRLKIFFIKKIIPCISFYLTPSVAEMLPTAGPS